MNKVFKKLKVSTIIIYLSLLSILFSSVIGIFGNFDMKKLNDTTNDMYDNVTMPISYIGSLRADSLGIELCVSKSNTNFDTKYETTINELDVKIQNALKSYRNTDLDPEEKVSLDKFEKDYTDYLTLWKKVNPLLANNQKLSPADLKSFESLGNNMENILKELRDYNVKWAGIYDSDNATSYKKSVQSFIVINIITILIFISVAFLIVMFIKRSLKEVISYLDEISEGDFTKKIADDAKNEFAVMKNSITKTVHSISSLIQSVKDKSTNIEENAIILSSVSEEMSVSSNNVSCAIQQAASGANSQANDLLEITNVLDQFSSELEAMVTSIVDIDSNAKGINRMANENHEDLQSLVKSVNKINISFKDFAEKISHLGKNIVQINEITNVINDISRQTNLLALNASIEAARAGESGKGFSVVAEEIRKLAEQSKISSENITKLISSISGESNDMLTNTDIMSKELNSQVNTINTSIESFKKIICAVEGIIPKIQIINSSAGNISNDRNTIQQKVHGTSSAAEEISASTEEITASTEEMNACSEQVASTAHVFKALTEEMMEAVNKFKLD